MRLGSTAQQVCKGSDMSKKAALLRAQDKHHKAWAHPVRRAIMLYLTEHEVAAPVDIAHALDFEKTNVAYHMTKLEELDRVELVRTEPRRGSTKHYYRATGRHLVETDEWGDLDPAIKATLLTEGMQPIVDDFTRAAKADLGTDEHFHISRTPILSIDREGFLEMLKAYEALRLQLSDIQAKASKRMEKTGAAAVSVSASLVCFEVPGF
jgi:DNA-binding transcriptional ArsR family regulator